MSSHTLALAAAALVLFLPGASPAQDAAAMRRPASACPALRDTRWPDVSITAATALPAAEKGVTVPHCKVAGVIGREIRFELLLPDAWNGRFVMGGGGGFVGAVANQAIASVNDGYATAGTDTGHRGDGTTAAWALGDVERQVNFGHVAVHRTAVVAKALVEAYYTGAPRHSYFVGCSNGGRQGLMEAQRYPGDFDGIVAGAPAFDFTNIVAAFVKNARALYPDPAKLDATPLPAETLKLLATAVMSACDARDGVTDQVLDDPRQCRFNAADLPACAGDRPLPSCVTAAQRAAIEQIYAPLKIGDRLVYHGQPFGGEDERPGWPAWITGPLGPPGEAGGSPRPPSLQWAFGTEFMKYFVAGDSRWDYRTYDFANWDRDTRALASFLNADNPDVAAFTARGKLLVWHGWSDAALNARATIDYYERALAKTPSLAANGRLFLLPGVQHCAGGAGPDSVDWLGTIAAWVEKGVAPDQVMATKRVEGKVTRTRPVCAHPRRAVYKGTGSTDDAASFECRS